ncbi:MAG: hypothetical protein PHX54_12940 [Lentimicrobiaceae bacterium]|nr:hypothetical protein [Lentimicrobiaceae bacterium]
MIKKFKTCILLLCLLSGVNPVVRGQAVAVPDSLFTSYFRLNSGGWTAGDATISIPLADGRVIWLFGDSYLANVDTTNNTLPCLFQIRNCMVLQDSTHPEVLNTYIDTTQSGVLRSTFKLAPNEPAILWPGHGYTYLDTVFIYLDEVGANMENKGVYLAKLLLPELQIQGIYPLAEQNNILTGRAVITDTVNGFRYIYGNKLNWIVWEAYVARMPIAGNPLHNYEYYNGTSWTTDPVQAIKIMDDAVSPGFSVFKHGNNYYLLTQENGYLTCGLGRNIYLYESAFPWGPFGNKKTIYTIDDQFNGHYLLTYNAQAHPAFTDSTGLLISYNLNDWIDTIPPYTCPSQCKDVWHDRLDADTYRPKFVRYPMETTTTVPSGLVNPGGLIYPNPVRRGELFYYSEMVERITLLKMDGSFRQTSALPPFAAPSTPGFYIAIVDCKDGIKRFQKLLVH